jgi:hypothetical protein
MRTAQDIVPLYGQRFSIALAKGEMAVITTGATEQDNLAHWFFVGGEDYNPVQRLVIVRLVEMEKMKLLYAD